MKAFIGLHEKNKSRFIKGFHDTFDEYCGWCESQCEKGLPTVSWGLWWEMIKSKGEEEAAA